jgi:hypothetical protein
LKDSLGGVRKFIIKFIPNEETIRNKYKNFKGTYEVMTEVINLNGTIKSNSSVMVANGSSCEVAYDIPCEYGNIHPEGNGPGIWCDGTGSHKDIINICGSGGSAGNGSGNGGSNSGGSNVMVPPTYYANNIIQCEDPERDEFIANTFYYYQTWAYNNTNDFNQILGGACGSFTDQKKEEIIEKLEFLVKLNISLTQFNSNEVVLGNFVDDPNFFEDDNITQIVFNFDQQIWPTISNVLSTNEFVGLDGRNCLQLAREQIGRRGLTDLGYGSAFKVYDSNGGPYPSVAKDGVNYIISKLQSGKPVIVGVDNRPGTPSTSNTDGKTDHFITIVGSGENSLGKYFTFFDNATSSSSSGTTPFSKLYYSASSGIISGPAFVNPNYSPYYAYRVTQIRKNK